MNDVELGPDEKSLIATAREANPPSEVQRARVHRGLQLKLAAGAAAPLVLGSTALAMVGKIGAGIALVAAAGAGTAYVLTTRPGPSPLIEAPKHAPPPVATPPVTAPRPLVSAEDPPPAPRPATAQRKSSARRPEVNAASAVDLAGELTVLGQVDAALRRGDATRASELLRSYDERFPAGELAEERAAAGILVLCASGRPQSAGAEASRFIERWPRSPLVARIKASCAGLGGSP